MQHWLYLCFGLIPGIFVSRALQESRKMEVFMALKMHNHEKSCFTQSAAEI